MRFLSGDERLYEDDEFTLRMRSNWDYPDDRLVSQYGEIPYREWLMKEKERIESRGGSLSLWKRYDGMVCSTFGHAITVGEHRDVLPKIDWEQFAL